MIVGVFILKIVILGDIHFGARNCNDAILYHQKKFFDFLFDYMKKNDIKDIYQLGDIFDNRRTISMKALDFAYQNFFDAMQDEGIRFNSLLGNHCIYYKEELSINSPKILLRKYNNVRIFDKPISVDIGGHSFSIVPWICDDNRDECAKFLSTSTDEYCLGHFEVNGFEVVNGVEFTSGLSISEFSKFKRMISGHFHTPCDKENISYVGSATQLTWNDAYRKKRFFVYDTETDKFTQVDNDDTYFVNVVYDDKNKTSTNLDELDLEKCFIKLHIRNKTEAFLYNNYVAKLYKKNPAEVKFIETSVLVEDSDIEIDISNIKIEDIITQYVDEKTDFSDKIALKEFLIGLYNEAEMQSMKEAE